MYLIKPNGQFWPADENTVVGDEEFLSEAVPDWCYEKLEAEKLLVEQSAKEDSWRVEEVAFIADQLIAIDDGDPTALPGTEAGWRAYRTKVRAWKEGEPDFPSEAHRPVRPS